MRLLSVMLCLLFCSFQVFSQKIVGRIVDENGKPISDVEIFLGGDSLSLVTYTNYLGFFEATRKNEGSSLVATHTSYQSVKVDIGNQEKILFSMKRLVKEYPNFHLTGFRPERLYSISGDELDENFDYKIVNGDTVLLVNDNAKYFGGTRGIFNYLGDQFSINMEDSIARGNVSVFFTVDKDGGISNIKVTGDTLQGAGKQIQHFFVQMPKWTPAVQRKKAVDQDQQIDIVFGEEIYLVVEESATFAGGMNPFYEYVAKKMTGNYPEAARRKGIQGKVFIQFVVKRDGTIDPNSIELMKGIGGGCDELALSVIRDSPPWQPGTQNGKAVAQRMVIPIFFKLN